MGSTKGLRWLEGIWRLVLEGTCIIGKPFNWFGYILFFLTNGNMACRKLDHICSFLSRELTENDNRNYFSSGVLIGEKESVLANTGLVKKKKKTS